jgi:hypothetical protein
MIRPGIRSSCSSPGGDTSSVVAVSHPVDRRLGGRSDRAVPTSHSAGGRLDRHAVPGDAGAGGWARQPPPSDPRGGARDPLRANPSARGQRLPRGVCRSIRAQSGGDHRGLRTRPRCVPRRGNGWRRHRRAAPLPARPPPSGRASRLLARITAPLVGMREGVWEGRLTVELRCRSPAAGSGGGIRTMGKEYLYQWSGREWKLYQHAWWRAER